jgi:5-methylcytosine-specific restriction endonuclease McrA
MKKKPLRRKKALRRQSPRQKGRLAIYYYLRAPFMENNPVCQICGVEKSTDVHHRKYRYGPLLYDQQWWMAVCRSCHKNKIHGDVKNARKMGWLIY